MLTRTIRSVRIIGWSVLFSSAVFTSQSGADPLNDSQQQVHSTHQASQQSQLQINKMSDATRKARAEYLANERMADVAEAYNRQIERLVQSQQQELVDLGNQLASIEETDQAVLPMLEAMVNTLDQFVAADLPFLKKERQKRLQKLRTLLVRADVSVAEKYRQILEAYLVEVQYGRTLESYSGQLETAQHKRQVNYLRLGRTALYYQTLNGQESALWLPEQQRWQLLDDANNLTLSQAIRIARQQQVPSLFDLPLPQPEPRS
ncbi:DUF3450 domain-containing protein [Endozoicomonadaceae bacterium StTr2]